MSPLTVPTSNVSSSLVGLTLETSTTPPAELRLTRPLESFKINTAAYASCFDQFRRSFDLDITILRTRVSSGDTGNRDVTVSVFVLEQSLPPGLPFLHQQKPGSLSWECTDGFIEEHHVNTGCGFGRVSCRYGENRFAPHPASGRESHSSPSHEPSKFAGCDTQRHGWLAHRQGTTFRSFPLVFLGFFVASGS